MQETTTPVGRLLLERYLASLKGGNYSPATIIHRRKVLRVIDHSIGLLDLTPELLETLADIRGWRPSTRYGYTGVAALFSAWMDAQGVRQGDPFSQARRPRQPKYRPRPITPAQLHLLETMTSEPVRSFVVLAAYAGLRRAEITACRHEHLEQTLLGWDLRVPCGKGGRDDVVPAHPKVVSLFTPGARGHLFMACGRRPYSTDHVGSMTRRAFLEAGVDATLHRLRHTFGTALYRATGDVLLVQKALRHEYLSSTQIYVEADMDRVARAVAML